MSSGARWIWRTVLVGFGLLLGGTAIRGAIRAASELGVTTDGAARQALWLHVVGGWLTGIGWISLYVFVAIGFRDWFSMFRFVRVPGGLRGARRANRQINGVEPYRADEIALLRRLAETRIARRRSSPIDRVGSVSVIVLFAGFATAPPGSGVWWLIFRIYAGAFALCILVSLVAGYRTKTDAKAETFLQRTQPTAYPPWEP